MKYLIPILCLFVFSCDDDDSNPMSPTPDLTEMCENEYSNVNGSLISCDVDCSLYDDDCFYNYDLDLLNELSINNESLTDLLLLEIDLIRKTVKYCLCPFV